jgi:inhibitor of cysteine peptidase
MSAISLSVADNGKLIDARVGDELVIRLPENPTTGYRWQVDHAEGVQLEVDAYEMSPPLQIGSGGVREFRFRAASQGNAQLRLKHFQAWEGEKSISERFALDINIHS